jgi:hypothetical protein
MTARTFTLGHPKNEGWGIHDDVGREHGKTKSRFLVAYTPTGAKSGARWGPIAVR